MYIYIESVSFDGEGNEFPCIDVVKQTSDGYEWVCECGRSEHPKSKENAILICDALNNKNLS